MNVAPAALAAFGQQDALSVLGHVGEDFTGVDIADQRADRHAQFNVVGALAIAVGATAVFTTARLVELGITIVNQGIDIAVGNGPDAAALAAVAAIRTAKRPEFFAAK